MSGEQASVLVARPELLPAPSGPPAQPEPATALLHLRPLINGVPHDLEIECLVQPLDALSGGPGARKGGELWATIWVGSFPHSCP